MATLQKIYSDIDFTFTKKPVVGDVSLSYDTQAVIRSIRNLLQTTHYDRPFNPDLGNQLEAVLFENVSPSMASYVETQVYNIINNYEPRARLQSVKVSADETKNAYYVTVTFFIENATMATTATILLERTR
jgi:phage baseplate assembly protein W